MSYKKNIKKKSIWLLFLSIILIVLYFVLSSNFKLNGNYLYKGELDSRTIYFKTSYSYGDNVLFINSDNKVESFQKSDLKQIKNKKIVYKADSKIEYFSGKLNENHLYFTLHTNEKNILVSLDLKNNKIEELLKEDTSGEYPPAFSVKKIVGDYVVMYYHGTTSGIFDAFVLNVDTKNRTAFKNNEISYLDYENIDIDLKNQKISYPKGKTVEVNCENNEQDYPMGCNGMKIINGKYYDIIPTKEIIRINLP